MTLSLKQLIRSGFTTRQAKVLQGLGPTLQSGQYQMGTTINGGPWTLLTEPWGRIKATSQYFLDVDTTPGALIVKEAGVYAVSGRVESGNPTSETAQLFAELDVDNDGQDAYAAGAAPVKGAYGLVIPLAVAYFIPAGGTIAMGFRHNDTAPLYVSAGLNIQKVS